LQEMRGRNMNRINLISNYLIPNEIPIPNVRIPNIFLNLKSKTKFKIDFLTFGFRHLDLNLDIRH